MQGLWNLIGKGQGPGRDFCYEIGEQIPGFDGKSTNGTPVTIFSCDAKVAPPDEFQVAKGACKRLRSIRHPNILRFIDSYESEALIYMVTEKVIPLANFIETEDGKNQCILAWGVHQMATALSFLVNDSGLCHENINLYAVYVDPAGEWKLGSVEYVHNQGADPVAKLPSLGRYDPPEGKSPRKREHWSTDSWGLGCLLWEIFNGPMKKASELKAVSKIPKNLLSHYCELVTANPKSRLNPREFLHRCKTPCQYLDDDFVKANLFLQEIQIKDVSEQKEFFQSLNKSLDVFPVAFSIHKILPELLKAFQFGAAGSSVLGPLFKIGKLLDEEEYQKKIVPCVVKLFSSNDRATRIQLLQQMDKFVHHLQPALVNDQVFPNVATGFGDTLPAMREQTVKSMILLAPKLSEKTINNQLLRYFAKLQMDEQPGIRTNTTICLGKIATYLPETTRQKVLIPAFLRSLRDPFPPARSAGILALAATQDLYTLQDIACKILPSLCSATIDNEKGVRDNTFKAIKTFVNKVEDASNNPGSNLNVKGNEGSQDAAKSSSWTGWAVSSLTSRIYGGQQGTAGQGTQAPGTPGQGPLTGNAKADTHLDSKQASVTQSKPSSEVPTHTEVSERSTPDFADAWSDDNWEDLNENDAISSMQNDLLEAKQEISHFNRSAVQKADDGANSDSDYGDWGNDDWGLEPVAPKAKTSEKHKEMSDQKFSGPDDTQDLNAWPQPDPSPRSVANLLGMENSSGDDFLDIGSSVPMGIGSSWGDADEWPPRAKMQQAKNSKPPPLNAKKQPKEEFQEKPFADQEAQRPVQKVGEMSMNESPSSWNVEGDWEGDGWGDLGETTTTFEKEAAPSQPDDKEAKKAELLKKREERKQQREQAMRERKQKGGGALKLGAVKKVTKGEFD
eukprot:gene3077-1363_t